MKKLIEKSIAFYGMGNPDVITDFNVTKPSDKRSPNYRELKTISGRKLSVFFDYETEEGTNQSVEKEKVSHKDDYLAKIATMTKAVNEEEDNAKSRVKTERTKKEPNSLGLKTGKKPTNGKLQLRIPKNLDNDGIKAFVLEQINSHLAS